MSKDPQSTGNLEMSVERKDNETEKIWVHRKMGNSDGFPRSDWTGFMARLDCGVKRLDSETETCDVKGVVSASEVGGPNSAHQIFSSSFVIAVSIISFIYV